MSELGSYEHLRWFCFPCLMCIWCILTLGQHNWCFWYLGWCTWWFHYINMRIYVFMLKKKLHCYWYHSVTGKYLLLLSVVSVLTIHNRNIFSQFWFWVVEYLRCFVVGGGISGFFLLQVVEYLRCFVMSGGISEVFCFEWWNIWGVLL